MKVRLFQAASAAFLLSAIPLGGTLASPNLTIWNSVAVCDPNNPANCLAPNSSGALPSTTNPANVSFGQVKIITTGMPVQLPSISGVNGFVVRAKASNTGVGGYDCAGGSTVTTTSDGTGNGACEPPGAAWSFGVSSAGSVYVNGAAGDVFFIYGN